MSIQSEITRINTNIANAYDAVDTMGGTLPVTQNSANLPDAIATLAQTDYIQLEWIEGTGCQYIDTGITPNDNYIIEMTASNHSNDDTAFFGANDTWNSNRLLCYAIYSRVYFRGSGSSYISHDVTSSTPYTIRVSSSSFTVNGANNQPQTTLGAINTTLKFFSGGSRIGKFKFYSAKVWNGNTLIGDYIPVLKKSTYDVGVYNKVDNTFINNAGLGYFRPGIKIAGYSILDYLQSSGAAWFDTGVSGGSKMEYSMAINTLGSKARNYEQYFAGDNSPVTHKVYMNGTTNTSPVLAQQANGVYWSGTSTNTLTLYNNADAWHNISFYSDGKLYLDTTLKGTGANNGWGTLSYYLFNSHSEPTLISSMRMRYLVMKTDGVIQRFYIPMQKESPRTLGVYDLVNDTFISSASNTAFTANQRLIIDDGTSSPDYPQIIVPTPSTKSGSIADQIDRINENIANAYDVCRQIGRTMPPVQNSFYLEPTILEQRFTTFTVTFENYDGTVLQTSQYYYGQTPSYIGNTPIKISDGTYDFHFNGWSSPISPVYSNQTYTAQFTSYQPTQPSSNLYYKIDGINLNLRTDNPGDYLDCSYLLLRNNHDYSPWYQVTSIRRVNIETIIKPITCSRWFSNIWNLVTFSHIDNLDTSICEAMGYMFSDCHIMTSLDLSNFNTENVTSMNSMFDECEELTSLDLTSFDTSSVTNMYHMFYYCMHLQTLDLSSFDMSNVNDTSGMFTHCSAVTTAYCRNEDDKAILDRAVSAAGYSWRFTVKE